MCIGVTRFELMTFCSQSRRSTRLSYTPSECKYNKIFHLLEINLKKNMVLTDQGNQIAKKTHFVSFFALRAYLNFVQDKA